jgi:hypothetical protein
MSDQAVRRAAVLSCVKDEDHAPWASVPSIAEGALTGARDGSAGRGSAVALSGRRRIRENEYAALRMSIRKPDSLTSACMVVSFGLHRGHVPEAMKAARM